MRESFRQSMAWLHTWAGLVLGWVLYFMFVTGTAGYFYVELDRWMRPELPLVTQAPDIENLLGKADDFLHQVAAGADRWEINLPQGRHGPFLTVAWTAQENDGVVRHSRMYDPVTQVFRTTVSTRDTGAGAALYAMHYRLYYLPPAVANTVIGFSSIFLGVILVAGIVIHKKIFKDFFTFRSGNGPRAWLDFHNVSSVLALPFFLMITYSGLVFIMNDYLPAAIQVVYGDQAQTMGEEIFPVFPSSLPREGRPLPMLPLVQFVRQGRTYLAGDPPWRVLVVNPGDASATVELWQAGTGTVRQEVRRKVLFSAVDGEVLGSLSDASSRALLTHSVLFGLHEGIFAGATLRWLYFGAGLLGCVMIATGLVLWTVKRGRRTDDFGTRLVECLNVGTIAGLPFAVAVYFWANRLLPLEMEQRAQWELHALFLAWGAMLLYAAIRSHRRAWAEVLVVTAFAYMALPVLNMLTTERHLGVTLPAGDWSLAGVDLTLAGLGLAFACMAWRMCIGVER